MSSIRNFNIDQSEIFERELEDMINKYHDQIEDLEEDIKKLNNIEDEVNKNSSLDWDSLNERIKNYENNKKNLEYLSCVRGVNKIIDLVTNQDYKNNIENLERSLEYDLSLFESLVKYFFIYTFINFLDFR